MEGALPFSVVSWSYIEPERAKVDLPAPMKPFVLLSLSYAKPNPIR